MGKEVYRKPLKRNGFVVGLRRHNGMEFRGYNLWIGGFMVALAMLAGIAAFHWNHLVFTEETAKAEASSQKVLGGTAVSFALLSTMFGLLMRKQRLRREMETQTDGWFHCAVDLLCITDTDGIFRQINPAFSKALGWTTHELQARPFLDFVHPDDRDASAAKMGNLRVGQPTLDFENRFRCKHGSWKTLAWRVVPQSGEIVYLAARDMALVLDITKECAARRALGEGDGLSRAVLNSMMANIAVINREGIIIAINEGWERFGLENGADAPLSAIGVGVNYLDVCERAAREMGDEAQVVLDGLRKVLADPGFVFKHEYPCHSPTENAWFVMHVSHLSREEGGAVISQINITDRKDTEQRIGRLNADLQSQADELAVANQELESFSYSVSHDLRAPLRHINGYVGMLRKATDGQLSESAGRYLNVISTASGEMGRLIDDLLAFSRMSRAEISETAVDLNTLVQQTLHGLEIVTENRNITWKISPLPSAMGDPAMLKQVFSNLIDNAVKYTGKRDLAEIEIGCAGEENARVIYFVRDNGAGFDMSYADKLFGVFQRLHRAEEFEGTGIGLASVRRILARHGDRVWAEGAVEKGATFYFTLKPATLV